MGETSREQESEPENISEIIPIEKSRGSIIKNREQIRDLVEAPLLGACEELYDKNIQTFATSANKKDVEYNSLGYVIICFDTLSDKNKKIAKELGEIYKDEELNNIKIEIPLNQNSTAEEIKTYAESIAHKFKKQKMTWAPRYTLQDLRETYCDNEAQVDDFTGIYYYDPESKLFYVSEEHFKKSSEKIED